MLDIRGILVSALILAIGAVGLAACGQKGPLFLPKETAAANRATLPQTLRSAIGVGTAPEAPSAPSTPAASPTAE